MTRPTLSNDDQRESRVAPATHSEGTATLFDELDELLERMLALPVCPDEPGASQPVVPEAKVAPSPGPSSSQGTAPLPPDVVSYEIPPDAEQEEDPPTEKHEKSGSKPSYDLPAEPEPLSLSKVMPSLYGRSRPTEQRKDEIPPKTDPTPGEPSSTEISATTSAPEENETRPLDDSEKAPAFIFPRLRYRLWELPLVWINKGFNLITSRFGSTGEKLQSTISKNLLGVVGILLLLLAGWLFLQEWLGWTW